MAAESREQAERGGRRRAPSAGARGHGSRRGGREAQVGATSRQLNEREAALRQQSSQSEAQRAEAERTRRAAALTSSTGDMVIGSLAADAADSVDDALIARLDPMLQQIF